MSKTKRHHWVKGVALLVAVSGCDDATRSSPQEAQPPANVPAQVVPAQAVPVQAVPVQAAAHTDTQAGISAGSAQPYNDGDGCAFCKLSETSPEDTKPENCASLPKDGSFGRTVTATPPPTLEATGLYCIIRKNITAPGIRPFRPKYHLWSDGAVKTRWVYLPPGGQIDTEDPDHWSFPVGTKFWKEFAFAGKRVETRLIARYGKGPEDFYYASYRWNAEGTAATLAPAAGVLDAASITGAPAAPKHDIPSVEDCVQCHGKLREHILGFSAIQLSHSLGGVTLTSLAKEDVLTVAPPAEGYPVPGDELDQKALGFLHANCSHCHNVTGVVRPDPIFLHLLVGQKTVEDTDVFKTAVNRPHTWDGLSKDLGIVHRIEPGSAARSELAYRLRLRGAAQMPPIATKVIDEPEIAEVEAWIDRLSEKAGRGHTP